MLINDVIALLEDLPRPIAAGWAVWLFVGLLLSVWQRHESRRLVVHGHATRHHAPARPASGVRSPARPAISMPPSAGDAFGELEALLEPTGMHRLPGDESPVLSEPSRS